MELLKELSLVNYNNYRDADTIRHTKRIRSNPNPYPKATWEIKKHIAAPFPARILYIERDIDFSVCGRRYVVNKSLQHIVDQIEDAKELLNYPNNWDDCGAHATDERTFLKAVSFLLKYSSIIKNVGTIINAPYIDILPDGSISLHWDTYKSEFLVVFKKTPQQNSYFYAKRKDSGIPYKSFIINDSLQIDEMLLFWMKSNLS